MMVFILGYHGKHVAGGEAFDLSRRLRPSSLCSRRILEGGVKGAISRDGSLFFF